MKLYKYISSESALKNIVSGKVKFATLDQLNDPTELLPNIDENRIKDSLSELRIKGLSVDDFVDLERQEKIFDILSPETKLVSVPKTVDIANDIILSDVYDNYSNLEYMIGRTIELIKMRCGIFCLSERYDSLPMWAHYSNNAKGFVVEFTGLDELFSGDETGMLNILEPVKYTKVKSAVTFERESYKSIFFEKNEDWSYENEVRIITNLDSCKVINIENDKIYCKDIGTKYINKVIFGWNVKLSDVNRISTELNKIKSGLECVVAEVNTGQIKVPR